MNELLKQLSEIPSVSGDEKAVRKAIKDLIEPHVDEWWVDTMKKVVQTQEWKDYLNTNSLSGNTVWGEDFAKNLAATNADFKRVLTQIGAIK